MTVERRVTTQDISWFLDLHRSEQLDLDPPYQRRSVWSPKDRRFFLDTIFRDYPSPPIFLHKQMKDGKTYYSVVDGKQRLETILMFADNRIAISKDFGDRRLAGKKWKQIKRDENLARTFWNYVIPVEFTNIIETNLVNEVFDRLNRNSRRLTEQELRHAKYDGWFINYVENESESVDWEQLNVVTPGRAKRMLDVQFLSELLIVLLKNDISGFDQAEINEYYATYDDLTDLEESFDEEQVRRRFHLAKKYLLELNALNSDHSLYYKDFNNLYTLWSLVLLNDLRLPNADEFTARYIPFMKNVYKYKDKEYLKSVIDKAKTPDETRSLTYYYNSIGASTELPQRRERLNVLEQIVFE